MSYEPISDLVAVFGRVGELDGSPAEAAGVEGCGASAFPDYETGEFMLFVEPEACELVATKHRNMGKSEGPPVEIRPVAGQDVVDIVLVAPPAPEWRDSTEEESERVREEQCRYWVGKQSAMVALLKKIHAQQEPGSNGAAEFAKQLREAEGRLQQLKSEYCGMK